jgi:hypothetical protein
MFPRLVTGEHSRAHHALARRLIGFVGQIAVGRGHDEWPANLVFKAFIKNVD